MSFLGMGPLEIVIILVIAFIALGPERMIDAARYLGRLVGEGRKLASDMPRMVVEDDDIKIVNAGETISMTRGADQRRDEKTVGDDSQAEESAGDDGPVAFTPASETGSESADTSGSAERGKTR